MDLDLQYFLTQKVLTVSKVVLRLFTLKRSRGQTRSAAIFVVVDTQGLQARGLHSNSRTRNSFYIRAALVMLHIRLSVLLIKVCYSGDLDIVSLRIINDHSNMFIICSVQLSIRRFHNE